MPEGVTFTGKIPSPDDVAASVLKVLPPPTDLTPVLAAIAAVKTDMDASFAALTADMDASFTKIAQLIAGGGPPPGLPLTTVPPAPNPTPGGPSPVTVSSDTTLAAGTLKEVIDLRATLSGAGQQKTILDGYQLRPAYDKAVIAVNLPGALIQHMTIAHAANSTADGANAAGIRDGGPGTGFVATDVEISGCQDGILAFPSNVTLNQCHIHHNGCGQIGGGLTHNVYIGGALGTTFTDNGSTMEYAYSGHNIKSRAANTILNGTTMRKGSVMLPGDLQGANLDVPNAGNVQAQNCTSIIEAGVSNKIHVTVGEEGITSGFATTAVLTNWTFNSDSSVDHTYVIAAAGVTIQLVHPTYIGPKPSFQGNVVES